MSPLKIPSEYVYYIQARKKHHKLFIMMSKTLALPGLYDEVVEVKDSPPWPVSLVSQLLRDRPKPVTVNIRARIPPPKAPGNPYFMIVYISLLLVSLETRYFNGLAVEVLETVLLLKDTPSFTAILFDHLRPLLPTIDLTNRDLWSLSYALSFSSKKIVTVLNTDKYTTPSSMLASGHFGNNQVGQLKVLVVLTSTDVVNKQEPVTPLRPDEYSTLVKEEKKRKRIKQEEYVKQGVHIKVKPEEPVLTAFRQSLTDDELKDIIKEIIIHEDMADPCEVEDPLRDLLFDDIPSDKGSGGMAGERDEVNRGDNEEILVPEFK
ncbi:hypothetical protein EDB81DRAFT_846881 [Dactylonectria macrodidyma]|uniref:Uncharacterized protein n=1 Tax=Dactylonectria macrodidyma TaxID=307937 RepID=A0A9P9IL90_9HYPO|nr:hypothetical protein EDB81DRAFT_846881 [Dactylonectria macrodidyma]